MKTIKVNVTDPHLQRYIQNHVLDIDVEELRRVIKENPTLLECDECSAEPGSPVLCERCLAIRSAVAITEPKVCPKNWRGEKWTDYYMITAEGRITNLDEENDSDDENFFNTLNYFRTEKQAEAYKEYQLAKGTVTRAIWDANGEWEADWSDDNYQYSIVFRTSSEKWIWKLDDSIRVFSLLPACKDSTTAEQIIKTYTPELEIIRNYKR